MMDDGLILTEWLSLIYQNLNISFRANTKLNVNYFVFSFIYAEAGAELLLKNRSAKMPIHPKS